MSKGNGLKRFGKWRFWDLSSSPSTAQPRSLLSVQRLEDRHVLDAVITALGSSIPGSLAVTGEVSPFTGGVLVAAGDVTSDGFTDIVTGPGPGGGPHVRVFDGKSGQIAWEFMAYDPNFRGGCAVAVGDVTGDGRLDVITGAGPGGGPHVKVFDGRTGAEVRNFFAFDPRFHGGVAVSSGDFDGDGFAEIVTGAGAGGGPHVKVFDGRTGTERQSFFAYADVFRGGVNVSVGDVTGDGTGDLITGAGPGGGPHVKVFDGKTGQEAASLFAYTPEFRGGVYVAAGDVTGDGTADLLTGAGAGGGPHVRLFDGKNGTDLGGWMAYSPAFTGGASVALADLDADGRPDVVTGAGPGGGPHVRAFSGVNTSYLASFFAYSPTTLNGPFSKLALPQSPPVPPFPPPPPLPNTPPSITDIADQTTDGSAVGPLTFTITDDATPVNDLAVTAFADVTNLITVALGGVGGIRTITLTPTGIRTGSSRVVVTVRDGDGATATEELVVTVTAPVEPQPQLVAFTDFADSTAFLYRGPDAVQVGMADGVIQPVQAAVIRGAVLAVDGSPLQGVVVSILNHSEYGYATSRADGSFDLVVNGGGGLTVVYALPGFLSVQRGVTVPWRDFALLPTVALTPLDEQVTTIDLLDTTTPMQSAQGSVQTDSDGTRRATLLFAQGTQAFMTLQDGTTQPLTQLGVRATEYTVGESGQMAMPGTLPPESGYTYAVELSVDQAMAAGATRVDFSQPVPVYVNNFLNFPVGMAVPSGYYDRVAGQWIASNNGKVIKILSETATDVTLDSDGDGVGDSEAVLAQLGVTAAERGKLVELFDPGESFWRTPVTHFTPYDYNWPYGPPPGAEGSKTNPDELSDEKLDEQNLACGSVIGIENQTLGERVGIAGTPYSLVYQSDRVPGRLADYTLDIPLSQGVLPPNLKRIELYIEVAGRSFQRAFTPEPNLRTTFVWDGLNTYGQAVSGKAAASVRIDYMYDGVYYEPAEFEQAFAQFGNRASQVRSRGEIRISQPLSHTFNRFDARSQNLGGMTLDIQHAYDADSGTLFFGDGTQVSQKSIGYRAVSIAAGNGESIYSGDGGQATNAGLVDPTGVAVAGDGTIYIADRDGHRIRRIGTDGIISTVAGTGVAGFSGDDGLATAAQFNQPTGIAVGFDGALYVADQFNHRIRKFYVGGTISTVAGNGTPGFSGDGGSPTEASINQPTYVAMRGDGTIFFTDWGNHRVRSFGYTFTREGSVLRSMRTVAGTGLAGFSGDGGPATDAAINQPSGIAFGRVGDIYIADTANHRVRRISLDGVITTHAGTGLAGMSGDGALAKSAQLNRPVEVAFSREGELLIADAENKRIRRVATSGVITTIAGGGSTNYSPSGSIDTGTAFGFLSGIVADPDGSIYVTDLENRRVVRVQSVLPTYKAANQFVPSRSGNELYVFSPAGRHLRTISTLTNTLLNEFGYDTAGRLTTIRDTFGNETLVQRSASGSPVAIVSPFGQRTRLTTNSNGYVTEVANPANETHLLHYGTGGLLTRFTDPRGNTSRMTYDSLGRLTRDEDPVDGFTDLVRTKLPGGGRKITTINAVTGTKQYLVEKSADGSRIRTAIDGRGFSTVTITASNGSKRTVSPDGTVTTPIYSSDPRFGLSSPVVSQVTTATPGGLTAVVSTNRSATFSIPGDINSQLTRLSSETVVNGRSFLSEYDAATRTVVSTSAAGRRTTTILDEFGRPVEVSVPGIEPTRYQYDSRGRIRTISQGNRVVTNDYDSRGRLVNVRDSLNNQTSFEYDAADRVTRQTFPDGSFVLFRYDSGGNLVGLTPPGKPEHTFTYNNRNQVLGETPPPVGPTDDSTRYVYNAARQLVQTGLPGGQLIEYAYCDCGRLTGATTPWGQYEYIYSTSTGELTSVASPGGFTVSFGYDGGLVTSETTTGPVAGRIDRTFDNNFRVTAEQVNNGPAVTFGYDADGLLTQAGELTLDRASTTGQVRGTEIRAGSGRVLDSFTYNSFGEISEQQVTWNAQGQYYAEFIRDSLGRITRKREAVGGIGTIYDYGYDSKGQLTSVTVDGVVAQRYAYDPNGNRLSLTTPTGTVIGVYDAQDRLLSYGTKTYTYDALGSLSAVTDSTTGLTTRYAYDAFKNLTRVELPDDRVIEYLIDGQNRRVGKKVNGVLVEGLVYNGQLRPVARLDGSGNVVERFVYSTGINVPAYLFKGGVNYRLVTDHLGSVRLVINVQTGEVAQRIDYDAFGRVTMDTNPGFQPFGFAGGLYEAATGLVRFGARDYDPESGRWTAKDPISFKGGRNVYLYSDNSPLDIVDFFGLEGVKINIVNTGGGFDPAGVASYVANGGPFGVDYTVSTIQDFLNVIRSQPDGSIRQIDYHGHGGPGYLKFSDGYLDIDYLLSLRGVEAGGLSSKFTKGATVNLLGCNVAYGEDGVRFLNEFAQSTLGVNVSGPRNAQRAILPWPQGPVYTAYP